MKIKVIDNLDPESNAMLQALYSRSPDSVDNHLNKLGDSDNFMSKYYIGYGHKSIGDCGTTTLFMENVSMLAAKAVQNHPLYCGQESSTRYINFKEMGCYLPEKLNNKSTAEKLVTRSLELYDSIYIHLKDKLYREFEDSDQTINSNAIHAAACDVARSMLPAGMKTSLSWHTTLSNAYQQVKTLLNHPLQEVQDIGHTCLSSLLDKYPNSFKAPEDFNDYEKSCGIYSAYDMSSLTLNYSENQYECRKLEEATGHELQILKHRNTLVQSQNKVPELPSSFDRFARFDNTIMMDFGSWRDLARHRRSIHREPVLTTKIDFEPWYLSQIDDGYLVEEIEKHLRDIDRFCSDKNNSVFDVQYVIPMGFKIQAKMINGLAEQVYIAELRSSINVHPTMRQVAHEMANHIEWEYGQTVPLKIDSRPSLFNADRGKQTIEEKS